MFDLRQYCHLELVPTTKMTPVSRRIRFYRVTEMIFGFTKVDFHHWGTWYILWNSARQNILASLHITIFISTQDKITIVSMSIFLALVKCRQPRKISKISKFAWLFPVHKFLLPLRILTLALYYIHDGAMATGITLRHNQTTVSTFLLPFPSFMAEVWYSNNCPHPDKREWVVVICHL